MLFYLVFTSVAASFAKHCLEGIIEFKVNFLNPRLAKTSSVFIALSAFFPASEKVRGEITWSMPACHCLKMQNTFVA